MKSVLMSVAEITEKRLQHSEALLTSALLGLRIQEEINENHKLVLRELVFDKVQSDERFRKLEYGYESLERRITELEAKNAAAIAAINDEKMTLSTPKTPQAKKHYNMPQQQVRF